MFSINTIPVSFSWINNKFQISTPKYDYGSIFNINTTTLSPEYRNMLLIDICKGLYELHACDIIHAKLYPSNIIITNSNNNECKICDFNQYKIIPFNNSESFSEKNMYYSNEIINNKEISKYSDIWSFGCVLYYLFTNENPLLSEIKTNKLPEFYNKIFLNIINSKRGKYPNINEILTLLLNNSDYYHSINILYYYIIVEDYKNPILLVLNDYIIPDDIIYQYIINNDCIYLYNYTYIVMIEYLIKSFNSYQNYNLFNTLLLIYWTIPKYQKQIKDKIDCKRYSIKTIYQSITVDRKIKFKSKIDVRNIMNKWYYECNIIKPIIKSFGFEDVVLSSLYINKFLNFISEFNKYKSLESLSFYCIYL